EDASQQGRISEIEANEDLFLIDETTQDQGRIKDQDLFAVHVLYGGEVFVDVITGGNVEKDATFAESVKGIAAATTLQISKYELALAQTLMEIKAGKPKAKGVTFQETTTIDAEKQLAEQIQVQKREQISIEERLLAELIESRRNFKQKDFKGKSFDDIKKMFDKVYKRVNTFMDMNTKNVEESLKKTQAEVTEELKRCIEIVPKDDEDVAIVATPLSSKSPTIVDYKIYRERKKSYFMIIRANRNSQNYLTFRTMFKMFNREDLEVLRSIIRERFKKKKPVDDMDNMLFQTLKTMFEHHVEYINCGKM
nr:hypothetical protein [Tanacetum cinerariifolium]